MASGKDIPAREIAERLLQQTGKGLMENQFDLFRDCFSLPTTLSSARGTTVIQTEKHFRTVFDAMRAKFRVMGVTELVRMVEAASYRSEVQIASTHVAHMFSGTARISEPFPVFSLIELQDDGAWRCFYSDYAVEANSPVSNALHSRPKLPESGSHSDA